jgi:hypothetical protein
MCVITIDTQGVAMKYRSLHLQEVEAVETAAADNYCFVVCKAASGNSLDVRLPIAEAKKLYTMLQRRFDSEKAAA